MISNDSICHVHFIGVFIAHFAGVGSCTGSLDMTIEDRPLLSSSYLFNGSKDRHENIRIIIRALVLNHRCQPFEAHAGINMLRWQFTQKTIFFAKKHSLVSLERSEHEGVLPIELNEDKIPDFQDIRIVMIDQMSSISATDAIEMDLGTRSTRSRVAHFPEVVLHITGKDVVVGQTREKIPVNTRHVATIRRPRYYFCQRPFVSRSGARLLAE